MKPLISLIARITRGERLKKATDEDYREQFGYFFFVGAFILGVMQFATGFMEHGSTLTLWLAATISVSIIAFGLIVWVKKVPASVSLVLGIITWGVLVWVTLRKTLIYDT